MGKIGEVQLRIRCPVCGMVSWQNTLNRKHEFEFLTQQKVGGRTWRWLRNLDPRGQATKVFKLLLARRLRQIAERLELEATREEYTLTSVERFAMGQSALI
jgi:hypothetical protein